MAAPQATRASTQPAFYLVVFFIFVTYARLPEILLIVTGHGLRLGLITSILAVAVVLLSGGLYRVLTSGIARAILAFTVWLCVCTPFSIWRGGSVQLLIFWLISLLSLVLVAGCVEGLEQCRRALYTMAAAVLAIEILSFVLGSMVATNDVGRFSFVSGTFANPNDFATLLLMGLPFCLLVARTRRGVSVFRVACVLGLVLIPITVVRTGSRGGLLALVLMFALYFISVPTLQKIPLAMGALLLGVVALVFASSSALERYRTIFVGSDVTYHNSVEASAAESTRTRKELFLDSLRLTAQHPIFGVGPGMFQVADAKDAEERKQPAAWHQTHNTFTQVSAEEGIPGLFIYMAALILCFKAIRSGRRYALQHPEIPYLGDMAFCLRFSMMAFTITAIFASNAYYFYFPLVAGLCAAFERSVNAQKAALAAGPQR